MARGLAATRAGHYLSVLRPDLVLLQEVNLNGLEKLKAGSGLDWLTVIPATDVLPSDDAKRKRLAAIGGRGDKPTVTALDAVGVIHPEGVVTAQVTLDDRSVTVASYYAPHGGYGLGKVSQAVAFANWLKDTDGPVIWGGDTNTPATDAVDFADTRTHWHSGRHPDLVAASLPGDDLLVGPDKIHPLDDALRVWISQEVAAGRPTPGTSPLAVSYRTGKGPKTASTDCRFDSIWISDHLGVESIEYDFGPAVRSVSDHGAVVADLAWR